MELDIRVGAVAQGTELGGYYLDFSSIATFVEGGGYGPIDARGIPLVDYDRLLRSPASANRQSVYGDHYTPVTVAQYGLGSLSRYYATREPEFRQRFLNQATWLLENLVTLPCGSGVWLHSFEFPHYALRPPWVSAMAQGEGISLLLRAYQVTGETDYLDAARCAFCAFHHDIDQGGVCAHDDLGNLWLEEYPTRPPAHVLNGFVFALWGVYDFYRVTGDSSAYAIWQESLRTLKVNLPRYERVFWSCYDLLNRTVASPLYHRIHILQLRVLEQLCGERVFAEYARRWQSYEDGQCRLRRLALRKIRGACRRVGLRPRATVNGVSVHMESE